ncbi:MAG: hypothetical protein LBL49_04510 [Clostridiales Family XIII bacterium]|jgi:hypothetical protein|nr:hypothetical protein [Clostridiales Family XIII bacterium]
MEIKCNKCGKAENVAGSLSSSCCKGCGTTYDLKTILRGIVGIEGETIYQARSKLKGLVMDLCKDNSLHPKVFGAIADRGVPGQILSIYKAGASNYSDLYKLERKTADAEGADSVRVHEAMAALYFGLTGKLYPPSQETASSHQTVPITQAQYAFAKMQLYGRHVPYASLIKAAIAGNKKKLFIGLGIGSMILLIIIIGMISNAVKNANRSTYDYTPNSDISNDYAAEESEESTMPIVTSEDKTEVSPTPSAMTDSDKKLSVPLLDTRTFGAIAPAEIITKIGNLSNEEQMDDHTFVASNSGYYRVEVTGMPEGMNIYLNLYNAGRRSLDSGTYYNNEGFSEYLTAGESYLLHVQHNNGLPSYQVNIGCQTATQNISGFSEVNDLMMFTQQMNIYEFTAAATGRHRFEMTSMPEGMRVYMSLFNAGGQSIESGAYANGGGFNVDLMEGQTYKLQIQQNNGLPEYKLFIGFAKPTQDISNYNTVYDSIQFSGQQNNFTFSPNSSGKYDFLFESMPEGMSVYATIYNAGGQNVDSGSYGIGKGIKGVQLTAGQVYQLRIQQNSQFGAYTLRISKSVMTN